MAPTISSLLNRHPVSLKPNLAKLANALKMPVDDTKTIRSLQSEIQECVTTYPEYEQKIRDMAKEISSEYKLSQSQLPSKDTQPDLFASQSTNQSIDNQDDQLIDGDLKRKIASIESSDDDDDDSDDDDDGKARKRSRRETDPMIAISHLTELLQQSIEQNKIVRREREEEKKRYDEKMTNVENELKEIKGMLKRDSVPVAQQKQQPTNSQLPHNKPTAQKATQQQPPPQQPPPKENTQPPKEQAPEKCQNEPLQQLRQSRLEHKNNKTTQQENINPKKPKVLIVSDSNGQLLDLQRLKPEAHVIRANRYTTKQAVESIPVIENPSEITDIIFQVGFNDYRKGTSAENIQENALDMQIKYFENFPQARQHITAIPPIGHSHNEVNIQLQNLSKFTETNFITTKSLRDRNTGKIRTGLMEGIHYNRYGISMVAREMKKSLYSTANRENNQLKSLNQSMKNQASEPDRVTTIPDEMEVDTQTV